MTASLPVPQNAYPDEPDGDRSGARGKTSPIRQLPPKPDTPADLAAQEPPVAMPPVAKAPRKRPPRKRPVPDRSVETPARAKHHTTPFANPGPPPPLPENFVIPPKPPLPVLPAVAPVAESSEPVVESSEPVAESSHVTVPVDAEGEPDSVVEPEPEPEPESVVEPEPELVAEAELVAEPVAAAQPETELDVSLTSVDELERALAVEPAEREFEVAPAIAPQALVAASADGATDALVVRGVTKRFGETRAVDGIDLTVPAGIFYGLVGPNGAGKTTTLSMIAGLLRPNRGTIRVNDIDSTSDPLGAKRQMGVLPDRLRTFDRLTGRQLLHYYGVLRGLSSTVVESRTTDLARAFDLSDALGRAVSDYSAGMVKKVMLAGAMIHSPRLLVLDEPFESVDPVSSAIILDILSAYVAHGGTVILSSHGMELVERVCSRVAVIVAGQVLAEGTVDEVRGELTLEQRFIELAGGLTDVEGLEWLHTFSD